MMTSRDLGLGDLVVLVPLDESFEESSTRILSASLSASAFLDDASAFAASRAEMIRSPSPSRPRPLLPAPDPQRVELPVETISSRDLGWNTVKLSGLGRSLARSPGKNLDDGMIFISINDFSIEW